MITLINKQSLLCVKTFLQFFNNIEKACFQKKNYTFLAIFFFVAKPLYCFVIWMCALFVLVDIPFIKIKHPF